VWLERGENPDEVLPNWGAQELSIGGSSISKDFVVVLDASLYGSSGVLVTPVPLIELSLKLAILQVGLDRVHA
jgi:hypothetical protein